MGPSKNIIGPPKQIFSQTNLVYHIYPKLARGNLSKFLFFLLILKISFGVLTWMHGCVIVLMH